MTRIETLAVHAGAEPDRETGAVAPPIHLATTFQHGPAGERVAGFEYQREHNPTQARLEAALAALEGGAAALAFGSGMAAMNLVLFWWGQRSTPIWLRLRWLKPKLRLPLT